TQSLNALGNSFTYNTGYSQNIGGMQVGADWMMRDDDGAAWVFGALLGYNKSDVHFDAEGNKADLGGWNFGGYGSYMNGMWFADLLVKDDLTKIDLDLPTVPNISSINGNTIGAKLTGGARLFDMDSGITFEPMASLAYAGSNLKNLSVPGSTFA